MDREIPKALLFAQPVELLEKIQLDPMDFLKQSLFSPRGIRRSGRQPTAGPGAPRLFSPKVNVLKKIQPAVLSYKGILVLKESLPQLFIDPEPAPQLRLLYDPFKPGDVYVRVIDGPEQYVADRTSFLRELLIVV